MASIPIEKDSGTQQSLLALGFVTLTGGVVLFAAFLLMAVIGCQVTYSGKIFPGVSINGIDLSGKTPEQAQEILNQQLSYPLAGRIVFQDHNDIWSVTPAEIGYELDTYHSAQAAFGVGRQGDPLTRLLAQFSAWQSGVDYPPLVLYDERIAEAYLRGIAGEIDQPTLEASLEVSGVEILHTPGQIGRTVDIPGTLAVLETRFSSFNDAMIPLEVVDSLPAIMDASDMAAIAQLILREPLTLTLPNPEEGDPGPWTFSPQELSEMMAFELVEDQGDSRYEIVLDTEKLRPFLEEQAPRLARYPSNARFIFNDDTRELDLLRPAVIGRYLDVDTSIKNIQQRLAEGEHSAPLEIVYIQPEAGDDATAASLGITELVSVNSSFFRGSSASRIHNIQTAASEFHGLLVPPWTTFSMAENMREVSLDNGYAEALIIYGGRTIEGVGGGVCQVSTTLFRTAFFGGYPINERHSHAYRVGYYEQTKNGHDPNLAGLDATVYVPVVDLQFTNNTPNWLLIETYINPSNGKLTWKFYSTSDNRSVDWNSTGPRNVVEPPEPRYEENPELARGQIIQVDWEAEGADITVTRIVYKDGQVLFEDSFSTHYEPWQAVFEYGPGTKIPKD